MNLPFLFLLCVSQFNFAADSAVFVALVIVVAGCCLPLTSEWPGRKRKSDERARLESRRRVKATTKRMTTLTVRRPVSSSGEGEGEGENECERMTESAESQWQLNNCSPTAAAAVSSTSSASASWSSEHTIELWLCLWLRASVAATTQHTFFSSLLLYLWSSSFVCLSFLHSHCLRTLHIQLLLACFLATY